MLRGIYSSFKHSFTIRRHSIFDVKSEIRILWYFSDAFCNGTKKYVIVLFHFYFGFVQCIRMVSHDKRTNLKCDCHESPVRRRKFSLQILKSDGSISVFQSLVTT
jgi:hypothetical protein